MTPTGEVHPVAALFPMMTEEELDDLAADIQANGLLHPILINSDGVLIDGRNRLAACNRVAYPPRFEIFDGEPAELIISANVKRRHLSLGQRAMAVVEAKLLAANNFHYGWQTHESGRVDPQERASMQQSLSRAYIITQHAPELIDVVMAGGSLDQAYAEALRRKRLPEELAERQLRFDMERAAEEERAARREEEWRQAIDLAIEEIGPEVEIPVAPNLDPRMATPIALAPRLDRDGLANQERVLRSLIGIRQALETLSNEIPDLGAWSAEGHVTAVRAAISQIVATAYAVADSHNLRLGETAGWRRVK